MTGTINDIVNEEHKEPKIMNIGEIERSYKIAKEQYFRAIGEEPRKSMEELEVFERRYIEMEDIYFKAKWKLNEINKSKR